MFITEYCAYLPWKAIYATKDDNVVAVGKHTYKKDKYNFLSSRIRLMFSLKNINLKFEIWIWAIKFDQPESFLSEIL